MNKHPIISAFVTALVLSVVLAVVLPYSTQESPWALLFIVVIFPFIWFFAWLATNALAWWQGFRTRSKPTAFAALMAKHDRMPKPAPFDGLEILVRPVGGGSSEYSFTICNTGEEKLFDLRIKSHDAYRILGPGDFGLDDTHMPSSLTREPSIELGELLPGEVVSLQRKRSGTFARYKGPASMQVRVKLRIENEARSEAGYLIELRVVA